ncbi:MAG: MBL fold metallo-hydrolase [Acidobacteria bacterium]|nr:MBL fold metallo-hydrolase [Acidobacteriota bacterium]
MKWNRREFLATSSLALAAGALRSVPVIGQAPAAAGAFTELRNGVGYFLARGATIGWAVTPDALVVVDTQFPDTAELCLRGLEQRSTRQIDAVINTHHHGDHVGGNAVFQPKAAMIVSHERVPGLQRAQAEAAGAEATPQAYADTTFADRWRQSFGDVTMSAWHHGPGHTGGDAVVLFEEANVAHLGDLGYHERHANIDPPAGASARSWVSVLEKTTAELNADTIFLVGHAKAGLGPVMSITDVLRFRDYLTAVLEYVERGLARGQSKAELAALEELPRFESFGSVPPNLTLGTFIEKVVDELSA